MPRFTHASADGMLLSQQLFVQRCLTFNQTKPVRNLRARAGEQNWSYAIPVGDGCLIISALISLIQVRVLAAALIMVGVACHQLSYDDMAETSARRSGFTNYSCDLTSGRQSSSNHETGGGTGWHLVSSSSGGGRYFCDGLWSRSARSSPPLTTHRAAALSSLCVAMATATVAPGV